MTLVEKDNEIILLDSECEEVEEIKHEEKKRQPVTKAKIIGSDPKKNEETEPIDGDFELIKKFRQISGLGYNALESEHTYNRPTGWEREQAFPMPARKLFFEYSSENGSDDQKDDENIAIDIETNSDDEELLVETAVANRLLDECEKLVSIYRPHHPEKDETEQIWDEIIPKSNWSPLHTRSFNLLLKILNSDRLSRLANMGHPTEAIQRRVTIEQTATRLRKLFADMKWNSKVAQWLHGIVVDRAPVKVLVCYLEAMQVLYSKIPSLVNQVINVNAALPNKSFGLDIITQIITKKSWDPVGPTLSQHRMPKLPKAPVFIAIGTEPLHDLPQNSRTHHWISLLADLGSVIPITNLLYEGDKNKMTIVQYLDALVYAVRSRIHQARTEFDGRPIILVGINAGSALMCQVALLEQVAGVTCFGFSVDTAEGRRGRPGDRLLEIKCPVLFVMGQCSTTASVEDMEEIRSRMRCVSGLLVVGGGDGQMRKTKLDMMRQRVNQDIVDRALINEVAAFWSKALTISTALPKPAHQPQRASLSQFLSSEAKLKESKNKEDKMIIKKIKEGKDKSRRNYYQERKKKMLMSLNTTMTPSSSEPSPKKQKMSSLLAQKGPQIIMVSTAPTILRTSTSTQFSKIKKPEPSPKKVPHQPPQSLEEKLPQITIVQKPPLSAPPMTPVQTTVKPPPTPSNNIESTIQRQNVEKPVPIHRQNVDRPVPNNRQNVDRPIPSHRQNVERPVSSQVRNIPRTIPPSLQSKTITIQKSPQIITSQNMASLPKNIRVLGKDNKARTLNLSDLSNLTQIKYITSPGRAPTKPAIVSSSSTSNLLRDLTPAQLLDAPFEIVEDNLDVLPAPPPPPPVKQNVKVIRITDLVKSTQLGKPNQIIYSTRPKNS